MQLANVSILCMLDEAGKQGRILDDYSEMRLVSAVRSGSMIPMPIFTAQPQRTGGGCDDYTRQISQDAAIHCEYQYGVSNEVFAG